MAKETFPPGSAQIYEAAMKGFDFEKSAEEIDSIIQDQGLKGRSILEIGVGTGLLAEEMVRLGYTVEGVDHSDDMINVAKGRLPEMPIHHADIQDFAPNEKYNAVISHAGPIRLDYTEEQGYFLETYLENLPALESAIKNIADSLHSGGLLIMSIEHHKGYADVAREPYIEKQIGEGRVAISKIMQEGSKRIKIRELTQDGQTLMKLEHTFLTIDLETLDTLFKKHGFREGQFDSDNQFYFTVKD